jgi:hypothetical protein
MGKFSFTFAAEMLVKLNVSLVFNELVPSSVDNDLLNFATEILLASSSCLRI